MMFLVAFWKRIKKKKKKISVLYQHMLFRSHSLCDTVLLMQKMKLT